MKSFLNLSLVELCHLWSTYNRLGIRIRPRGKIFIDYTRYYHFLNAGGYRRINFLRYVALLARFRMMHYDSK